MDEEMFQEMINIFEKKKKKNTTCVCDTFTDNKQYSFI